MKKLNSFLLEAFINKSTIGNVNRYKPTFKKEDLSFGTVVMLRDKTIALYFPEEKINIVNKALKFKLNASVFLCCIETWLDDWKPLWSDISSYDLNLLYRGIGGSSDDVIRVYSTKFPEDKINENFVKNFVHIIRDWIKDKKYIERK